MIARAAGRSSGPGLVVRAAVAWVALATLLMGCASLPRPDDARDFRAAYPGGGLPHDRDGRARFRQVFCDRVARSATTGSDAAPCDDLLWRLSDEPPPAGEPAPVPTTSPRLRILVVTGAFGDCSFLHGPPYGEEIARLAAEGVAIAGLTVAGRSSAEANARQIADTLRRLTPGEREGIVLIGYSKGAVDILHFLASEPELARGVVAVVSVAGPIFGSPLADDAEAWYRALFSKSFGDVCDPGDGGVVESLRPATRRQWLADHPLPTHVRYFSIAAFPSREHLNRALAVTWRMLAATDRINDGQVLARDAVIPGSTLLGYVDADHWDVAVSVERQFPWLSSRPSARRFPRAELLDAILDYVAESLAAEPAPAP